ncbi:acyl-CoA dehydrogenase family protein [Cumulibacter soli]|uniref:acyl-CoA dehydrogenase family protein n=1 Tax=Cumulibacter soli TaxID=2546344 RepID=UPI001067B23E|nr:acyl-CoA dehydrogenase family protein [Cumulibacter soli]
MDRTIYNEDHEAFRSTIRSFIAKEITPNYPQWQSMGYVPHDFYKKLAGTGATAFDIPEEYGGAGKISYKYQAVMTEEAARAAVSFGNYDISTGIIVPYLRNLANEEQQKRWFPGIASGELLLAIAMTEPGTGSDLAGIQTTARLDGGDYVINGAKTFITGSSQADLIIVVARTSAPTGDNRREGLSLLVMDTKTTGFEVGRRLDKIGLKSSDTCELSFTDVHVPAENLLGEEGKAFSYLGNNLPRERLTIAVQSYALARSAIEHTVDYVKNRQVFDKPLSGFQNTKFVLADCAATVEAAEAMVDRAIEADDAGTLTAVDAAKAKLFCTEMAGRVADKCLQLHGGYGYVLEYPIAKMYADTRVSRIYGGTSEVMRTIIAKSMSL